MPRAWSPFAKGIDATMPDFLLASREHGRGPYRIYGGQFFNGLWDEEYECVHIGLWRVEPETVFVERNERMHAK